MATVYPTRDEEQSRGTEAGGVAVSISCNPAEARLSPLGAGAACPPQSLSLALHHPCESVMFPGADSVSGMVPKAFKY